MPSGPLLRLGKLPANVARPSNRWSSQYCLGMIVLGMRAPWDYHTAVLNSVCLSICYRMMLLMITSIASQVAKPCKSKFRGSAGFGDLHLIRDHVTFLMRIMAFEVLRHLPIWSTSVPVCFRCASWRKLDSFYRLSDSLCRCLIRHSVVIGVRNSA